MFNRNIETDLLEWKQRHSRKPLVLRGARQTGKTTVVRKFAKSFDGFVELNLEKDAVRRIFSEITDIGRILQSIEGVCNRRIIPGRTLLFIDEIQNSVSAVKLLRFFQEEAPDLHVIAAGSLSEVRMKAEGWSFPVGRVEFRYLYPATFEEFLAARGEGVLLDILRATRVGETAPPPVHGRLTDILLDYMVVGGMPEAVASFAAEGSVAAVRDRQEALFSSFKEDFSKYARGAGVGRLKSLWEQVPFEAGRRIKYSRLCGPEGRSREVSDAFDVLHDAMLIERIYPTTRTEPPLVPKPKAAPKAQYLDIGLVTHVLHLTREQLRARLASSGLAGGLAEAFVGQEILAAGGRQRGPLFFWVREEKDAISELDFLVQVGDRVLPIEVKSGSHGSLKSLHQFLKRSGGDLGIRLYDGPLRIDAHRVALPDRSELRYRLLSVPFYLAFRLAELCGPGGQFAGIEL